MFHPAGTYKLDDELIFPSPRMDGRGVGVWNEATPASRFVHAGAADGDTFFRFESALRVVCRLAAPHADSVRLGDVLGNRQKLWHRLPGVPRCSSSFPHEILSLRIPPSTGRLIGSTLTLLLAGL
jgi:hypothetical protein